MYNNVGFDTLQNDIANTYYILADPKLDKDNTSDSTQVEYNVDATYMVTIPAKVTLKSDEEAEASVKAEKVKLAKGQQVIVKLTGAKNVVDGEDVNDTATDNKFSAKTADGKSTATYTIKDADSKQVGLNDTVASFETKEEEVTKKLTFSKAEGATFAGEHTETLTFTLSVGEAAETKTITVGDYTFTYTEGQTWGDIIDSLPDGVRYDTDLQQFKKGDGKILKWADNRSHQVKTNEAIVATPGYYDWNRLSF